MRGDAMMRSYQITNSPYPGAYHPHQPCLQRSSCSSEGRGSRLGCKAETRGVLAQQRAAEPLPRTRVRGHS
jgi:hypothetical protein